MVRIFDYYKHHGHATEVMAASFRNLGEIRELAGCDLMTISPKFLGELSTIEEELPRKLDPERSRSKPIEKIDMDEASFKRMHALDRMATDKLAEGIESFSQAIVSLEAMLEKRLSGLAVHGS